MALSTDSAAVAVDSRPPLDAVNTPPIHQSRSTTAAVARRPHVGGAHADLCLSRQNQTRKMLHSLLNQQPFLAEVFQPSIRVGRHGV